jgi:hypothetical protein
MSNLSVFVIGLWLLGTTVVIALALLGFDGEIRLHFSNAMQLLCSLGGGVSCLITAGKFPSGSALKRVWWFIGTALVVWFFAQLIFAAYPLANNGEDTPSPYYSDILYQVAPVLIVIAMILFKRAMNLQSSTLGLFAAIGVFALTASVGLVRYWDAITGPDLIAGMNQLGYAVMQPAMLGATVWVATCFRGGAIGSSWWIAAAGVVLYYLSDLAYFSLENYQTGYVTDIGWLLGFGLIGLAALRVRDALR